MEVFPNSPHLTFVRLIQGFQSGQFDQAELKQQVELVHSQFSAWSKQLEALDFSGQGEKEVGTLSGAKEATKLISEAVDLLKDYADDPKEEKAQEAIERAQQGSMKMAELIKSWLGADFLRRASGGG